MTKHNVVIVGAGPGGGATAVRLMQNGIKDVVLLDKDEFPRDKTCGSALSPNGLQMVTELGLADEVKRLGTVMHSLIVTTPGNKQMRFTTEQAAIVLLRKHFDNQLVERAKALGADFRHPQGFGGVCRIRHGGGRGLRRHEYDVRDRGLPHA